MGREEPVVGAVMRMLMGYFGGRLRVERIKGLSERVGVRGVNAGRLEARPRRACSGIGMEGVDEDIANSDLEWTFGVEKVGALRGSVKVEVGKVCLAMLK